MAMAVAKKSCEKKAKYRKAAPPSLRSLKYTVGLVGLAIHEVLAESFGQTPSKKKFRAVA
jgi:hypothetical protein